MVIQHTHTHTHPFNGPFSGTTRVSRYQRAGTRKVKPIWILLKQETVSGSGISWAICQSARRSRQIATPAPHHSVFYRPGKQCTTNCIMVVLYCVEVLMCLRTMVLVSSFMNRCLLCSLFQTLVLQHSWIPACIPKVGLLVLCL